MSVPRGPRDGRGRGRGSATTAQRGSRGFVVGEVVDTPPAIMEATSNRATARQYKPPPAQNGHRGTRQSSPSFPINGRGGSPPRNTRKSTSPPNPDAMRDVGGRKALGDIQKRMNGVFHQLKNDRDQERADAIKNGFLADPNKPTSLANAITPVGTCKDMCPPFERAERIVQQMVEGCEKQTSSSGKREPCEAKMVKRFRRSAAGYDEQLPSDIRPPLVLQKTLYYLVDKIVGGPQPLAMVHKFVWDRTRGIRNDFSIQQVTKLEDLRIAINCFEQIARFHILSLHQLSRTDRDNSEFNHHQEREQLNNTLLSLMYYYDDSRHRLKSPNEAEFRAYCIIFEIQDQRPDLEDRAQQWPRYLLRDQRVQTALKLYAAAGNTSDEQGPLRPRASFAVAQADTGRFWQLLQSSAVPYTMACVAEIYFNLVRRIALETVWKAYKGKRAGPTKMEDWILADLALALGFDDEVQAKSFVEDHGFQVAGNDAGQAYVDLGSVSSKYLSDSNPQRKQVFSETFVESKRLKRTLPAIMKGFSASEAQKRGLIIIDESSKGSQVPHRDSLFISGDSDDEMATPVEALRPSPMKPKGSTQGKITPPSTKLLSPPRAFGTAQQVVSKTSSQSPLGSSQQVVSNASSQSPFGKSQQETPPAPPTFASLAFGAPNPFAPSKPASSTFGNPSTGKVSTPTPSWFGKPSNFNPLAPPFPGTEKREDSSNDANQVSATNIASQESTSPLTTTTPLKATSAFPNHEQSPFYPAPKTTPTDPEPDKAETRVLPSINFTPAPPTSQSSPTSSSDTPKYSFGTSPLFTNSVSGSSQGTGGLAEDTTKTAKASNPAPPKPKPSPQSTSPISTSSQILDPEPQTSKPTTGASYQFPIPQLPPSLDNTESHPPPNVSTSNDSSQPTKTAVTKQNSPETSFSLTGTPPQPPPHAATPKSPSSTGNVLTSQPSQPALYQSQVHADSSRNITSPSAEVASPSHATFTAHKNQPDRFSSSKKKPETDRNNNRSQALNTLAKSLMLDDQGLLQQFIEYTVGPIVTASIRQLEDERSWQEARKCRTYLLSLKYLRFWKTAAWRLGLLRKGRERRKNFAQSMRDMSQSAKSQTPTGSILGTGSISHPPRAQKTMPPPTKPSMKRNSLPVASLMPDQLSAAGSSKRKLDEESPHIEHRSPQRRKVHHKRWASTVPSDLVKDTSSPLPKPDFHHSPRLSFMGKTDTTQTDYFRLKALGIDPDTPRVPLISKKPARIDRDNRNEKHPRRSLEEGRQETPAKHAPPAHTSSGSTKEIPKRGKPSTEADEDSDEALFARLRKVRDAMSDSITWFQSEREKSERASSAGTEVSLVESPAQKKLREFKTTPSRTEQRLRSTGAHGLLPKAWSDNPSWRDANGRITTDIKPGSSAKTPPTPLPPEPEGRSVLTGAQRSLGKMGAEKSKKENGTKPIVAGSSADDAIEL